MVYNNPFGLRTIGYLPHSLVVESHFPDTLAALADSPQERAKVLYQLVFMAQAFSLLTLHGLATQPLEFFALDASMDLKCL